MKTQNPQQMLRVSFAEKEGLPSVFPLTAFCKCQSHKKQNHQIYLVVFLFSSLALDCGERGIHVTSFVHPLWESSTSIKPTSSAA